MSRTTLALVVALVLAASGWSLFGWEVGQGEPHNPAVVEQRSPCRDAIGFARWYTAEGGASIVARLNPTTASEGERLIFDMAFENCLTDSPEEP